MTVHRKGSLDVPAFERSFNEIIRRHEAWRTTFTTVDRRPVQVVNPAPTLRLPVVDLRGLPEAEREPEALRLASEDARQPFDLGRGPLLRANLIRLRDDEHRFVLTLHHIIFDGVSIYRVFLPELAALYEAFSTGKPSPLPEPTSQYADYAHWQREGLQGEALSELMTYWKKQLAGNLPVLELPTDRPRPAVQSFRGAMEPLVLSKTLTDALKALSQREGVTLYMTLLAAFKALLYRYSGQEDILIGSVTSGRNHPELENLMGFFLSTVVLRTNLAGNPTFRELLGRVRDVTLEALSHDEVPFEDLVKELQPQRDPSHNPLFQVLFSLEAPLAPHDSGWALTQFDVDTGAAKYDLYLQLDDRLEGVIGRFIYNTDLFDASTIVRMRGHWQTLLQAIVADAAQHLEALTLLTDAERRQLLEWNDTKRPYPHSCVHELFEAQVERTPDAVAVVFEDRQLTFRELNRRANQVAHHLRSLGVGPEALVGICVERSLGTVEGLLGVLKAGGAYVPLDPEYPKERLAFMVRDSGLTVLLTQEHLRAKLSEFQTRLVCLDAHRGAIAQQSSENCRSGVEPGNLAYVIYTSGSTGRPKGVEIAHRSLVNFLAAMQPEPGLTAKDTLLAVTTTSFDIAALELHLPLTVGARVVLVTRDTARDGTRLREKLATSGATLMQATPATWRLLLDAGWQGSKDLKILCGGEALPRELANELVRRSQSVWNMYGPTETTIWSTLYRVGSADGPVFIGRPIANTEIYVLDNQLQPVPMGVAGELYIGGDGLARGYLDRPELTAEKFIPNSVSKEPGARLYKTGDRARYWPDGNIEFLGRLDDQVKIRGRRIELGELEAVLGSHPGVREAVVLAREDVPGERRLVGYLVAAQKSAPSLNELYSVLRDRLPEYMIPRLVVLETLPLTPNRKVDRRALPAPDLIRAESEDSFVGPRNPVEEVIAGIWTQVLGVERVSTYDNFFDLGGHSLLAMQVIAGLEEKLGLRINPRELMFQTLGQLAAACEERLSAR
ncbi:MAG: hypothetical protein AUI36_19705 [Cyanobacteria bacterium 13_1_40CM_2_61_4]|nr:MAG: hypothetical protein AUI36_19705 [Cyanobacteria bacterium 13_1_40CM_2_61_4]